MLNQRKVYFENLDALRFLAALAVVCYHIAAWLKFPDTFSGKIAQIILSADSSGGDAGVNFFFVLSGFLITYLLFEELEANGHINIVHFYIRRLLRIWPLYFLSLFIGFIVYPLLVSNPFHEQASWKMYVLFLANFDNMFGGWPQTGLLGIQWSVSVEEQFYLVWPWLFLAAARKNLFPLICLILIICSQLFILRGYGHYHPLSCMRELSWGALAAWFAFHKNDFVVRYFQKIPQYVIYLCYGSCLSLIVLNFQIQKHSPACGIWTVHIQTLLFVFVILEQNYASNSFYKFGTSKQLTAWGRISYGLYLLHMISIYLVAFLAVKFNISIWLQIPVTLAFAILLAEISFRYFEQMFLSLKQTLHLTWSKTST